MKRILYAVTTLILGLGAQQSYAADPAVISASITPAPAVFPNGGLETFQFQLNNYGSATSSAAVTVTISLSTKLAFSDGTFDPASDIAQTTGTTPFTWSWNASNNTLTGTLNGSFTQLAGNTFQIRNLRVMDSASTTVPNIGGNVNIVAPGAVNSSTTNDNTSAYTYTVQPIPTPVTLLGFTAEEKGCAAELNWSVTNAVNFSHFQLEYSSDSRNYQPVARLDYQKGKQNYSYTYAQPQGKGYYRLKMADLDGAYEYSNVVLLSLSCSRTEESLALFPNPVQKGEGYTLRFESSHSGTAQIVVTDVIGKVYERNAVTVTTGSNNYPLSTKQLASGIYMVQLLEQGQATGQAQKLIVK